MIHRVMNMTDNQANNAAQRMDGDSLHALDENHPVELPTPVLLLLPPSVVPVLLSLALPVDDDAISGIALLHVVPLYPFIQRQAVAL
jgi:hypothetical protein